MLAAESDLLFSIITMVIYIISLIFYIKEWRSMTSTSSRSAGVMGATAISSSQIVLSEPEVNVEVLLGIGLAKVEGAEGGEIVRPV